MGDFQSAFDLTAGLKRHLARRPEWSHRALQGWRILLVPPEQRRARRFADRYRSLGQNLLDRGPRRSHSADHRWRRALGVDFFTVVRGSWRDSRLGCAARHDFERPEYQEVCNQPPRPDLEARAQS